MLPAIFYFALLTLVCTFALVRGGREEKIVAVTAIAASLASAFLLPPLETRYGEVEAGIFLVDTVVLVIFVGLALRSRRFWPLWIAGIQLTTNFSHLIKAVNASLLPAAYAVAAQFWVYPILLILFVATWRTAHKRAAGSNREIAAG